MRSEANISYLIQSINLLIEPIHPYRSISIYRLRSGWGGRRARASKEEWISNEWEWGGASEMWGGVGKQGMRVIVRRSGQARYKSDEAWVRCEDEQTSKEWEQEGVSKMQGVRERRSKEDARRSEGGGDEQAWARARRIKNKMQVSARIRGASTQGAWARKRGGWTSEVEQE